jgi:CPA2 family monovalent cation:H+ antiporter-2
MDPALPTVVLFTLIVLLLGLLMRILKQPSIVAYILAGIVLGPHVLSLITDQDLVTRLGEFGVVILLFFIGMEVVPEKLIASWKISIIGTFFQIFLSILLVWFVGHQLLWPFSRILLLGFVVSLSSTAVVLNLFSQTNELATKTGQTVLGILLTQDLAVIGMMITLSFFSEQPLSTTHIVTQFIGAIVMIGLACFVVLKKQIHIPWAEWVKKDHELQVFAALVCCFGLALISSLFNLSTALGAFLGGMLIGRTKETEWVRHSLESFRVIFVALFFVSLGLMVDLKFVAENILTITALVVIILLSNLLINAVILKSMKHTWKESLYAGSVLSPIGEFSFILAAIGYQINAITQYGYQLVIAIIVISLLISPLTIGIAKKKLAQ